MKVSKGILLLILFSLIIHIPQSFKANTSSTQSIQPNQDYKQNIDYYIYSQFTGKNYSLRVVTPNNYNASKTYPVLLFMNYVTFYSTGNSFDAFGNVVTNYNYQQTDPNGTYPILVSVLDSDFTRDSYDNYIIDMTENVSNVFKFFDQELVPFILSKLPIDPGNITLSGIDYGANMVLQSFFEFPNSTIQTFMTIDGIFHYNSDAYLIQEQDFYEYSQTHKLTNRTLVFAIDQTTPEFKSGLQVLTNLMERGYQNQNIIVGLLINSYPPYVVFGAWLFQSGLGPNVFFLSSSRIDFWLGNRQSPSYYANETIEFIFFGNAAFHTLTYQWYVDGKLVGTKNTLIQVYNSLGSKNITLVITDEKGNKYSNSEIINIDIAPVPPFDFQTVESTTLNNNSYKLKSTANNVLDFSSVGIIVLGVILPQVFISQRKKKKNI